MKEKRQEWFLLLGGMKMKLPYYVMVQSLDAVLSSMGHCWDHGEYFVWEARLEEMSFSLLRVVVDAGVKSPLY